MSEEECGPCKLSAGLGMYLSVCKSISSADEKECDEIYEKLVKGEYTAQDVFRIVKEKVKDRPDDKAILEYIDDLMAGKIDEKAE